MVDYTKLGFDPLMKKLDHPLKSEALRGIDIDFQQERASILQLKLASGAIGTDALADNSITTSKLASAAVTTAKISNNSITNPLMADGAIGADEIQGLVIVGTHIAGSAITNAKINDFDHAKGTGNVGTAGTWRANTAFQANGTAGIATTFNILDRNPPVGTITHTFTFTYGLLTSYGTA